MILFLYLNNSFDYYSNNFNMSGFFEEYNEIISKKKIIENVNDSSDICIHENIISTNEGTEICTMCGLLIDTVTNFDQEWRYYGSSDTKYSSDPSRVQYRKEVEKGILKELEKYDVPHGVCSRANNLYNEVTKGHIKRGRTRLALIFACVFNAYIEMNDSKTSDELRDMFDLERREASRALTFFKTHHSSRSSLYISSYYFIPMILNKFKADPSHENNIKRIYKYLEKKDISKINGSNPKSISAGLVYYYLININKIIDPDTFSKIVGLSKITILKISKFIASVIDESSDDEDDSE